MRRDPFLLLVSLCLGMLLLGGADAHAQKILSGTIAADTTLDTVGGSIYRVTSSVTVNAGVTLTINPGVVLKFDSGRSLTINGRIDAVGGVTAATRIYFTSIKDDNVPPPTGDDTNGDGNSTVPGNRDWIGIIFNDSASDLSVLQNCDIQYGGSGSTSSSAAVVRCEDASPNLIDCNISAGYYGVRCNGDSDPLLQNTTIDAMTDVPVAIEIEANPRFDNLAFGSSADNGFDAIGLLGSTLTGTNRLSIRGATLGLAPVDNFVYILLGDIVVSGGAALTIQPGVVLKPKNGVDITVNGTLTMAGTADPDSQIVVTSFADDNLGTPNDTNNDGSSSAPAISDWGVIEFLDGSSGVVSNAVLKFGGETTEGVVRAVNSSPFLGFLEISDCSFGVEQRGTSASQIISCDISNTTNTPIYMSVSANPTFALNTFTNVGVAALGLINETIAVDSLMPVRTVAGFDNITYWLYDDLTMSFGSNLRIEPGVVLKFRKPSAYPVLNIEGSLIANGTPDSLIVFTSQYDDDVGNPADTEGNGTATVADDGQWGYVKLADTSDDLTTVLDHCVFSYGGQQTSVSYRGAVWCNSSSPTITDCQFLSNETGIRTDGNAAPLIQDNFFFNNDEVPLATSVLANPTYVGNTFNQNQYHAVGILAETLSQDATLEFIQVGGPPQFPDYFPYLHLGTLTVGSSATLTVQPGVVVKVLSGGLPIYCDGGLNMTGTPAQPIVYTSIVDDSFGGDSNVDGSSTSPSSASWNRIEFRATTNDAASILDNCLFRFGGSSEGVVKLESASPTIQFCQFEINRYGLWIQNASNPTVENNLFRLIDRAPISKSVLAQPTFANNAYDNNAYDVLGLIGENIAQDLTLQRWDVAGYTNITRALVNTTLNVNFGSTLTIESGVVLKMGGQSLSPFQSLIQVSGSIDAQGTALDPVVFTSIRDDDYGNPADSNNDGTLTVPGPFQWQSITIADISDDLLNNFDHCVFRYGGWQGYGVLIDTASPTFSNCRFDETGNYGVRIQGNSQPVFDTCTFANQSVTPMVMSLGSDPVFSGNVFEPNNTYNALGILGETLASDVRWKRRSMAQTKNIPYILTGSLTAGLSSILRIDPGVVVKPLSGVNITVRRGLVAEATAEAESLIVFTSPYDDFYGGDTNNDGNATEGANLRWGRIEIANEAIDDSTRFRNCVFRYATNSTTIGALNVTNANPQVDDCVFNNNGIGVNYNGAAGDPAKGHIRDCDIYGNTYYGVKNTGMSFTIDAQNNWWGDASGPLDDSDDTGSGGLYNPLGLGDEVTDRVDYSGWDTTGVQNVVLGDVSLNGDVRAFDSSLILQDLAALITLGPLQDLVGDVNCSGGNPSTLDASLILRLVAELDTYFPCSFETVPTKRVVAKQYPGSEPGNYQVWLPSAQVEAGLATTVPIQVSGSGDLLGHEYAVAFDPTQVTIENVVLRSAASGASMVWNATPDGTLRVALASAEFLPVEAAIDIVVRGAVDLAGPQALDATLELARLNEQTLVGGTATGTELPTRTSFQLEQNLPNPFNPSTTIRYALPGDSSENVSVRLSVYDMRGREVRRLVDGPQAAGDHQVIWNGRDASDRPVASGVYFYKLVAGDQEARRKMLLLK